MFVYRKPMPAVSKVTPEERVEKKQVKLQPGIIPDDMLTGPDAIVPKVYKSKRPASEYGPITEISNRPIFDLFTEQTKEMGLIRRMFHDWAMPPFRVGMTDDGNALIKLFPLANFQRGVITASDFRVDQYLYAVLNFNLVPAKGFGDIELMNANRTQAFVCINVGDPRFGILSGAKVEYALPLNTPVSECVELVYRERNANTGADEFYYDIKGNEELAKAISDKWFSTKTYLFNGTIYPMVNNFAPVSNY